MFKEPETLAHKARNIYWSLVGRHVRTVRRTVLLLFADKLGQASYHLHKMAWGN